MGIFGIAWLTWQCPFKMHTWCGVSIGDIYDITTNYTFTLIFDVMDNFSPSLKSRSSLQSSSSSRPASRRLAMHTHFGSTASSLHVPVDQVLFLPERVRSKSKGSAVLVTSEAGMAKFWDLFGHKEPVGTLWSKNLVSILQQLCGISCESSNNCICRWFCHDENWRWTCDCHEDRCQ